MKKTILLLLIACASVTHAQDYVSCIAYNNLGNFEKAKSCINSLKSKYPNDPAYFFYSMHQALGAGDVATAQKLMENIGLFPQDNISVLAAKTIYLVYTKDINQAKAVYEPVLKNHKLAPESVLLHVAEAFINFKAKDPEYTLSWMNILEKEMKTPSAGWLMLKGNYFAATGDQGNALTFYNKVLDVEPNNSIALYKKAVAYRRIKNPEAANAELDAALKITAEFPFAILEKGEVLFELNKPDDGLVFYNKYFQMVPSDLLAHLQLGASLFSIKKYDEAQTEAERVLQSDSKNTSAMKLKSYACYELGKYEEGLPILQNYISITDTASLQSKDFEYLAHYYQKTGSDSMAIDAYKKALHSKGAKAELYSEAGSLMVKKGRYEDAFRVYQDKVERFSGTSADYYNYGRAASAIEQYSLADSLFTKVTEMQPNWPNGYLMRANTNAHLDPGSTEGRALFYYEKYITLAEADTVNLAKHKSGLLESYKYLGYYNYLAKNIDASKRYWKKVLELDPEDKQAIDVLKQL